MYPAYETIANLVVVIVEQLRRYVAAYEAGEFDCRHDEMPQVRDLINRAEEFEKNGFYKLGDVQPWFVDLADVSTQLWD